MLKNLTILFAFLGIFIIPLNAQDTSPISAEVKKTIQKRVDSGVNQSIVVGVIDENGTHFYNYGVKSLKTNEPVDEKSVYEIGSISKTFTGILLGDMVVNGKMKLDDPVQKYLPEGVTAPTRNGESIKMVHLSNHTSSLPRMPNNFTPSDPANPYFDYTEKQLYEFLNSYELTRDIGSQFEYSNYAQGLLGHLLAKENGMTFEELMIKKIAKPLKMKSTAIVLTPKMKKNLAKGHNNGVEVSNWDLVTMAGAGAIRSTTVDMLKYLKANMGMQKSKLYPAMQMAHKNTREAGAQPVVGLGWLTMVFDDMEIVWHNGGTGGYRTFAGFIKGGKKAVVVMTNSTTGVDDIGIHLLRPQSEMEDIKPPISAELRKVIESKGIEEGMATYWSLKKENPDDYDFSENELNNLGYYYLGQEKFDIAIAIFKANVKAFPKAFNPYDSLGEAYMKNGDNEKAIANYKKSVELNPGNSGGIAMLKKLGVNTDELEASITIDEKVLESYVGKYELMPEFILTITKNGTQLEAQATGQPKFDIFPKSKNVFFLKVVEAQLTFNINDAGDVESVTLLQGGQTIEGKKIE